MPLDVVLWALAAGTLAGGAAAWLGIKLALQNSFATEREQVRGLLARARIDLEEAASELEKWSQRGARERARVEQSERRGKANGVPSADSPHFPDVRSYQRHLVKGGARDLDVEAAFWGRRG